MPIELAPEIEKQVREAAEVAGVDPATFIQDAIAEKLRQNNFARPLTEAELLERINRGFPEAFWDRYRALIALRDAETLEPEEQNELIAMTDRVEQRTAERLGYLTELSRRRGTHVRQLIAQLGLRPVQTT